MKLPKLYKKNVNGSIQFWEIETIENDIPLILTRFGQVGTEKPQITEDSIKKGKNIGKKNETTPIEQANIRAKQLWDKQIKKGYVEELEQAKKGENELSGINPMLAQIFEDREQEIQYPCIIQPKLDGIRMISICQNGEIKLYSRTHKPIKTVPHIQKQLQSLISFLGNDWILDGELYNHDYKENFNELISIIKRDELHENHTLIEYHIYDIPSKYELKTSNRMEILKALELKIKNVELKNLKVIKNIHVDNREGVEAGLVKFLELGYEGAMVRTEGPYEFKRSKYLLKYKKFQDAEFRIVGVEEGKGKLSGHAGSFICLLQSGNHVNVKMIGELKNLKEMFDNFEEKYLNKMLTVKFFGYTEDGSLRFPVGMRIRIDE